jgi:hypothetical protein
MSRTTQQAMKTNKKILAIAACALVISFAHFRPAITAPGSVSVSPAFINTSVSSAEPERVETVTIKNNFDYKIRLAAIPYGVDKQSGRVSATEVPDEVLEQVITISDTDFSLEPDQSVNLKLLIKNSPKLSPGGHYAAILIKQIDEKGKDVGIEQAVGISLYIIKEDGAIRSLRLDFPSMPRIRFSLPEQMGLSFENTGNVVVIPRASNSINSGSNVIAQGAVNENSQPVSPGNKIELPSDLKQLSPVWLPSKMIQNVSYRYDGQDGAETVSQSFIYVPWQFALFVSLIIGLCIWQRKNIKALPKKIRNKLGRKKVETKSVTPKADQSKEKVRKIEIK